MVRGKSVSFKPRLMGSAVRTTDCADAQMETATVSAATGSMKRTEVSWVNESVNYHSGSPSGSGSCCFCSRCSRGTNARRLDQPGAGEAHAGADDRQRADLLVADANA